MKISGKHILALAAALIVCLLLAVLAGARTAQPKPTKPTRADTDTAAVGSADAASEPFRMASFTAETLDGGTFTQEDIAAKDVTVLNFWATTCGPCISEMPELAAFAKALPENVQVVTVCFDGRGNEETVSKYLDEAGYTGVTLVGGEGDFLTLCGKVIYTPTAVFLDAEGTLAADPIVGGRADLAADYLAAVNAVLAAGGKDAVRLADV